MGLTLRRNKVACVARCQHARHRDAQAPLESKLAQRETHHGLRQCFRFTRRTMARLAGNRPNKLD